MSNPRSKVDAPRSETRAQLAIVHALLDELERIVPDHPLAACTREHLASELERLARRVHELARAVAPSEPACIERKESA